MGDSCEFCKQSVQRKLCPFIQLQYKSSELSPDPKLFQTFFGKMEMQQDIMIARL